MDLCHAHIWDTMVDWEAILPGLNRTLKREIYVPISKHKESKMSTCLFCWVPRKRVGLSPHF